MRLMSLLITVLTSTCGQLAHATPAAPIGCRDLTHDVTAEAEMRGYVFQDGSRFPDGGSLAIYSDGKFVEVYLLLLDGGKIHAAPEFRAIGVCHFMDGRPATVYLMRMLAPAENLQHTRLEM